MRMVDNIHQVTGASNASVSTLTPDYVKLAHGQRLNVLLTLTISSGAATGAVTLKQATAAAGTGEKALAFTEYWLNHTVATNDLFTLTTATSNTFNAGGAAETRMYQLEVKAEDLDVANGFSWVRLGLADVTNGTATITYHLYDERYKGAQAALQTAIA